MQVSMDTDMHTDMRMHASMHMDTRMQVSGLGEASAALDTKLAATLESSAQAAELRSLQTEVAAMGVSVEGKLDAAEGRRLLAAKFDAAAGDELAQQLRASQSRLQVRLAQTRAWA